MQRAGVLFPVGKGGFLPLSSRYAAWASWRRGPAWGCSQPRMEGDGDKAGGQCGVPSGPLRNRCHHF